MGSPLRLTVVADAELASVAWSAVVETFNAADAALSRFRPESALTRLNQRAGDGRLRPVPQLLRRALAAAWRAYRRSEGTFDPRIIGALERAGEHAGIALPASPPRLAPDQPWLALARRGAALAAPVDLGGIGKGLALRWSASGLHAAGVDRFLLEAGGDVVAGGLDIDGLPWAVAVREPGRGPFPRVIALRDGAVATSATTVRRWRDANGEWQHHLIDPRTGRPARTGLRSSTVVHRDPAWAEVWSKVRLIREAGSPAY